MNQHELNRIIQSKFFYRDESCLVLKARPIFLLTSTISLEPPYRTFTPKFLTNFP